mgnify:CR=1 FL=1
MGLLIGKERLLEFERNWCYFVEAPDPGRPVFMTGTDYEQSQEQGNITPTSTAAAPGTSDDSTHESIMSLSLSSLEPQKQQRNNITVKPASSITENQSSDPQLSNGLQQKSRSARPKRQIRKQKTYAGLTFNEMQHTDAPDLSEYQQLRANALKALQESQEIMNEGLPSRQEFGGRSVKDILEEEKTEKISLPDNQEDSSKAGNDVSNQSIGNTSAPQEADDQIVQEPQPPTQDQPSDTTTEKQQESQEPAATASNQQGLTRQQRRERLRKQATFSGLSSNERPNELQLSAENQAAEDREARRQRRQQLRKQGNTHPVKPASAGQQIAT